MDFCQFFLPFLANLTITKLVKEITETTNYFDVTKNQQPTFVSLKVIRPEESIYGFAEYLYLQPNTTEYKQYNCTMYDMNKGKLEFQNKDKSIFTYEDVGPRYFLLNAVQIYAASQLALLPKYHIPAFAKYRPFLKTFANYNTSIYYYIYWYCTNLPKRTKDHDGICPHACREERCESKPNSFHGSCQVKSGSVNAIEKMGLHSRDYVCDCFVGYVWNPTTLSCDWGSVKLSANNKYCPHPGGYYEDGRTFPTCPCPKGFTGRRCEKSFDPCLHVSGNNSNYPPGFIACNAFLGNFCSNDPKQDDLYTCHCVSDWESDSTLPYPNCKKRKIKNKCTEEFVCFNNGICVAEKNYMYCKCTDWFIGDRCHIPLGIWAEWLSWSSCSPECGSHRKRYRIRDCLGDTVCIGDVTMKDNCPPISCESIRNRIKKEIQNNENIMSMESTLYHAVLTSGQTFWRSVWIIGLINVIFFIFAALIGYFQPNLTDSFANLLQRYFH